MKNILKKASCFIIAVISVFCITACDSGGSVSTTKNPFGGMQSSHGDGNGKGNYDTIYEYMSFEETLEEVNTIVKAKLLAIEPFGAKYTKFVFNVNEVLLGDAEETLEAVISETLGHMDTPDGRSIYFSGDNVVLNGDDEYLLLLSMSEDVYSKVCPLYLWKRGMMVNLDDLSKSEMYNESLALHATGIDVNNCTKEEMIDYVCRLTEGNVPKNIISKAETLEEIVEEAYDVIRVRVKSLSSKAETDMKDTEIWYCSVREAYKGKKSDYASEIEMVFFDDTVEMGKEYIVAIQNPGTSSYIRLLTKDSLRPLSEKAEIKGYID